MYLSSQLSLPEMRGRRRMTSWRKFFAAWHPGRALSAAGLGCCNRRKEIHLLLKSNYTKYVCACIQKTFMLYLARMS